MKVVTEFRMKLVYSSDQESKFIANLCMQS